MKNTITTFLSLILFHFVFSQPVISWDFDNQLQAYFAAETERIVKTTAKELASIEDWPAFEQKARAELLDMLGLNPMPEKTPLQATITGVTDHEEFRVEKVHFQSSPGLYVTGNLYVPKNVTEKMPAILYVCGHANVKKNGISYGAKVNYHHHAAWFARHGYVCLIIDTLQLGEIEGTHHGLYRYDRWWWISRGYTPAGVEAWNDIRAVDYLISRPEVDGERIGMTGRSGGGINSWWGVAIDERIKVAVPVAGLTDLTNHVVDGCVEGHCDCMYLVNNYQWDYAKVAALAAPRALLISNTDRDEIYPIDGVFRTYMKVRGVYDQLDAKTKIALNTATGPHKDIQELRIHAFRWFNHFLQGHDELIERPAIKFFQPEQLRVFDELPRDEINTRIDETFVTKAPPVTQVLNEIGWQTAEKKWLEVIDRYAFAKPGLTKIERKVVYPSIYGRLDLWELSSDEHTKLPIFHLSAPSRSGQGTKLIVLNDEAWEKWSAILGSAFPASVFWADQTSQNISGEKLDHLFEGADEIILLPIRGAGPAKFSGNKFEQTHILRRYYLLGQTLEELQTLDIVQALKALELAKAGIQVEANGASAGILVYASLFAPQKLSLFLNQTPISHQDGPAYLSIMRHLDLPAALLLAAKRHSLKVQPDESLSAMKAWEELQVLSGKYVGKNLELIRK